MYTYGSESILFYFVAMQNVFVCCGQGRNAIVDYKSLKRDVALLALIIAKCEANSATGC